MAGAHTSSRAVGAHGGHQSSLSSEGFRPSPSTVTLASALGLIVRSLSSKTAITSFIVSFGVTKAVLNLIAARLSERVGRKPLLVVGWLFALPVPFLLIYADSWWWIDVANISLGPA
jgi:MFS family permease